MSSIRHENDAQHHSTASFLLTYHATMQLFASAIVFALLAAFS
jgi:hypothetical protein